jgi:SAM-dependent MidA family methyltransferase
LKRHSDSRWSCKAAAASAISRQLEKVIVALVSQLCDTLTETFDTREDAALILICNEMFEFVAVLFFWSEVRSSIDRIQKCRQAEETTFHQTLKQLGNLIDLINNWKNELCARAINDAEDLCNEWGVTVSRRIKKIHSMPGENASDAGLSSQEEMLRTLKRNSG